MRIRIMLLMLFLFMTGNVYAQTELTNLTSSWSYLYGSVETADPQSLQWIPVDRLSDVPDPPDYDPQIITYRTTIEKVNCRNCALYLGAYVRAYDVYIGGERIIRVNGGADTVILPLGKPHSIVQLPAVQAGQELLITTNQTYSSAKLMDDFRFGEMTDLYYHLYEASEWTLIIGLIVLITSIIATILFLTLIRDRSLLYLSVCSFNAGIFLLCRAPLLQNLWGISEWVDFLEYFSFALIPLLFGIYIQSHIETVKWTERIIYGATGLMFLTIIWSALKSGYPIYEEIEVIRMAFMLSFLMLIISLLRALFQGSGPSKLIIMIFVITAIITAALNLLDSLGLPNPDLVAFAGGFFMLSQIFVFIDRFRRMDEERTDYFRNLTDANRKLEEMDHWKDGILANTSHELRTPLHGMIGIAESLIGNPRYQDPFLVQNLKMIVSSGFRLNDLINDILEYSKMQKKEVTLERAEVKIRPLIDRVYRIHAPLISGKHVSWLNRIPEFTPPVNADENRMEQIFHNLIGNAFKFTERGSVAVDAHWDEEFVTVQITDTGIGIRPEDQERIFESFEQAEANDERNYGGTGLGLAITKSLVELHQGTITVSSEVGKGSVFQVTFPRK